MTFEPPIHWSDHEDIAMKLYERFGDDFGAGAGGIAESDGEKREFSGDGGWGHGGLRVCSGNEARVELAPEVFRPAVAAGFEGENGRVGCDGSERNHAGCPSAKDVEG